MPERELSPEPEPSDPILGGHMDADDIELPRSAGDRASSVEPSDLHARASKKSSPVLFYGSALLIAAVLAGAFSFYQSEAAEKHHAIWQHVAAATNASSQTSHQLVRVDSTEDSQTVDAIGITAADIDHQGTRSVRAALAKNDVATANAALQSQQRIPNVYPEKIFQPEIEPNSELAKELQEGKKQLFKIELFDSCDEDGDVVEVLVNGELFATVPILHQGTLLSIPLSSGKNTVAVRGARDGGGGVTLSLRTSRGDFFARHMRVGQEYRMGVMVQ